MMHRVCGGLVRVVDCGGVGMKSECVDVVMCCAVIVGWE